MSRLAIAVFSTIVIILTIFCYDNSYAASGWTSYGNITGVQADSTGVTVYTNITTNPTACSKKNLFYYNYSSGSALGNRMYATILAAQARGVQVRFYVGDTCNAFGQTRFSAINSK
jgi:hypothetical protein